MTNLTLEEKKELIRMALAAREKAYVPYSDFMVGAALRAKDGRIFTGCNVENAAFTPTSCAERTALFKAVAEGVTEFTDIAVVGSRRGEVNEQITSPCGVCRQALFEFGGPELNVIMAKTPEDFIERSMDELLPFGFGPSNVAGNRAVRERDKSAEAHCRTIKQRKYVHCAAKHRECTENGRNYGKFVHKYYF